MEPLTLTDPRTGRTIESRFATDAEAVAAVRRMPDDFRGRDFATTLANDFDRYGSLFPGKRYYLHLHASEWRRQEIAAEELLYGDEPTGFSAGAEGRFERIVSFLRPGALYRKEGARVTLISGPYTIAFKRTTEDKTRYPNNYLITGMSGYGENGKKKTALGRIDPLGFWFPTEEGANDPVSQCLLDLFEDSPAACIEKYASNKNCCFCGRDLTDPISKEMKYGPICADLYNLPWSQEEAAGRRMRCAAVGA